MRRTVLAPLVAILAALVLTGCSISITSNSEPGEDLASVEASDQATPNASEQAFIDQDAYNFCALEAKGSLDLIGILGNDADQAITDGIAQSISSQQMNDVQAVACKKAWIETLQQNGITYNDPDGGSGSASPATSAAASPAASASAG